MADDDKVIEDIKLILREFAREMEDEDAPLTSTVSTPPQDAEPSPTERTISK